MWHPPTLDEMQAMLPQYQFISLLGRGGMGAVYKAVQVSLDRPVAIKVLPGDLVMDEDVQFAERFKNEARTMARMNHPSIVNVFDFGETQTGLLYIVMEFINGTDVAQLILSQGRLTPEYALAITEHVCDALNYAHRSGIVHRDIKPANILINMEGAVKVADFGLAKANDAAVSGGLTKTNMAMGTPDFVAPEAFIPGFALDGRADLYAIGVMLYQMLTGEVPRGMWTMPSQRIGSDPRFDAVIAKAMQTDRELRYQTASEIHQDLHSILTTPLGIPQQPARQPSAAPAVQKPRASAPQLPHKPQEQAPQETALPEKSSSGMIYGIAAAVVVLGMSALIFSKKEKPVIAEIPVVQTPVEPPKPEVKQEPVMTPDPVPIAAAPPVVAPVMTPEPPVSSPAPVEMVATAKPTTPEPVMPAPVITSPAPVTPPVDTEVAQKTALLAAHPRLTQLENGFQAKLETEALKTYRTAVASLNQSYLTKGIATKRSAAQAKGSLVEVTALDTETALIKGGGSVPVEDGADTPDVLKELRKAYRGAEAGFAKERDAKASPIYDIYVKALDAYIAELTRTNKIADAQQVKVLRDEVATKRPNPAPAVAAAKPTAPAAAAMSTPPAAPKPATGGSVWRATALYLVSAGGTCVVSKNGANMTIAKEEDIPSGKFDILELSFDRLGSLLPQPKNEDFRVFNGLRDLRRVLVRNVELTDPAFEFLSGNDELNWVSLEGVNNVTDAVVPYLMRAKRLDFLGIQYAKGFTGSGLDKLPCTATLTNIDLLSSGITDEGLKAISNFKKLQSLRVNGGTPTDAGFTVLAKLKELVCLDLYGTTFGDEAATAISTLPNLAKLELYGTKITDVGLKKLQSLKTLTSIGLGGTTTSLQAAADFQAALPQCRVNR